MTEAMIFDTLRQALWIAVVISVPILTVALLAGIVLQTDRANARARRELEEHENRG